MLIAKPNFSFSKLAVSISFTLLLPACSMLPSSVEKVHQLEQQQQYDDALKHYQRLNPEQQKNIDIEQLKQARESFEKKRLELIKNLQKRNEFQKAYEELKQSLKHIPSSEALQAQKEALQTAEKAYFDRYHMQYDMALAEFYINEAPILERLNQVVSNNYYYQNLYQKRPLHRQELAEKLGSEGLAALEKNHKATALQLLQLANQLHPEERWQQGLNTISSAQKKRFAKAHKKQQQQQHEKIKQMQGDYQKLIKNEQWLKAQQQLDNISGYNLNHKENIWLKAERKSLQETVNEKVAVHLKRGQILYSKGRIGEALSLWRAVAPLAPENQKLQENITRAEQFQKRYNELRK